MKKNTKINYKNKKKSIEIEQIKIKKIKKHQNIRIINIIKKSYNQIIK